MAAWKKWLHSLPLDLAEADETVSLDTLRIGLLDAFHDCGGARSERVRLKLAAARTARDLWLLRGEVFQVIADHHCQSIARDRINALLPAFEGWLPARLLSAV